MAAGAPDSFPFPHGTPCFVQEVVSSDLQSVGRSITILARVIAYDPTIPLAIVEGCIEPGVDMPKLNPATEELSDVRSDFKENKMIVDTSLIDPFTQRKTSVYRFIGEVYDARQRDGLWDYTLDQLRATDQIPTNIIPKSKIILKPRIVTNMDGLDLHLWRETMKVSRKIEMKS